MVKDAQLIADKYYKSNLFFTELCTPKSTSIKTAQIQDIKYIAKLKS